MTAVAQRADVPLRPLLVLGGVVLAAHVALLQMTPARIGLDEPTSNRKFVTRTIEINRPEAKTPGLVAGKAPAPPATPISEQKVAVAPVEQTPVATNSIATSAPEVAPQAIEPSSAPVAAPQPVPVPVADHAPLAQAPDAIRRREDITAKATAFSVPGSARLGYNVTSQSRGQTYNVRAELLWLQDGSSYDARLEVSALFLGARVQTSTGRLTGDGLAPTRFADKGRSEVAAHFERDKGKVTFSANTPDAPLLAGAQDRLSVFLQLASMLAGDPARYPAATTVSIQTIGPRDADTWLFTVDGEETLKLPYGELKALKLTRNPRREYDQRVELWFAPTLSYMPARIRLTQANGDYVDQQLRVSDKP